MSEQPRRRILRGVRVATPEGMHPASVHIAEGVIVAVAGYDEVPRGSQPEELGKALLIPGLVAGGSGSDTDALAAGITTRIDAEGESVVDTLSRRWTAMRNRDIRLETLVAEIAAEAGSAGFANKGAIAAGCDADLCSWQPEWSLGRRDETLGLLYGQVRECIVAGVTRYRDGRFL